MSIVGLRQLCALKNNNMPFKTNTNCFVNGDSHPCLEETDFKSVVLLENDLETWPEPRRFWCIRFGLVGNTVTLYSQFLLLATILE